MGQACCGPAKDTGASHEELIKVFGDLGSDATMAATVAGLAKILEEHPYLKPTGTEYHPHNLLFWVRKCREFLLAKDSSQASDCLQRINRSLDYEMAQVKDAFRRFDHDGSGHLDGNEFKFLCAYIGWGEEEAAIMDIDKDQSVTLEEFRRFVGHMGGLQQLFELRRQRVSRKQWGTEAPAVLTIGDRIRCFYHVTPAGTKSSDFAEAQVLELNVMPSNGVRVLFGFGVGGGPSEGESQRQVIPPSWIRSDVRDSDVVSALREVGILEEQQAFWASIFPQSEMRAVEKLVPCQRAALAHVRANASMNHEAALPEVRKKFEDLGYGESELQAVFGWIQDLAPMCVHIHLDSVGRFLETDEYYRTQFETGTSNGALDGGNDIRRGWERELFGGHYDDCKPFERSKYGALGVMNDYRGVTSAYQYGDSYLVLKDVRLRTTFAAKDSGGISGSELAVLDKYAHVLKDYHDHELRNLVEVAKANTDITDVPKLIPTVLRGMVGDCTSEWVTVGFPDLPQSRGKYYFEVELLAGCQSPQVGLLSTQFKVASKVAGMTGGVGDDEFGWSADGQHAMRWHAGNKLPWTQCWKSSSSNSRELAAVVVVGIAVDIDNRKIWFASDGEWDDENTPAFGPELIPRSTSLYPALSLMGRAAFNFGPDFKHDIPTFGGYTYARWPKMPDLKIRADCPIVGNSNTVSMYKEIQVHGELSLKRNVQRLVANRKYLDRSKNERSWGLQVDGTGHLTDGTYARTSSKWGFPVYTKRAMGDTGAEETKAQGAQETPTIYCDKDLKVWRLALGQDSKQWFAQAPLTEGFMEAPREGWEAPREAMGVAADAVFTAAMEKAGVSAEDVKKLTAALSGEDSQRKEKVIFRVKDNTSFEEEWKKLNSDKSADEAWQFCIKEVQQRIMAEHGLQDGMVIETEHPYPAKSTSWEKLVTIESAKALKVQFSKKCVTYDSCASMTVMGSQLNKASAGVGSRAQLKAVTGYDQVHGTLTGKAEGGKWSVAIDSDEKEICGAFRQWLDASPGRSCTAVCVSEQKVIYPTYEEHTVGEEIAGFKLDPSCPMTPFSISAFSGSGPAQAEGAMIGWFLDVEALLQESAFREMEGDGFGDFPASLANVADNLEGFEKRLEALRKMKNVTLAFCNGLDFQLLPSSTASYKDMKVSDEIQSLSTDGEVIRISGFSAPKGPAQDAGVRSGWQLNVQASFDLASNKTALASLVRTDVVKDPAALLEVSNVTLMFEPVDSAPTVFFQGYSDMWTTTLVPFSSAKFFWQTDGDGSYYPDRRWGIFALVTPADDKDVDESVMEAVASKWAAETQRVMGVQGKLSIEPEDWDETRMRALCKRHGWEFEWMTEEGERRRRIEGAEEARKAAHRTMKEEDSGAWWRLDSVAKALWTPKSPREVQRKITAPPPIVTKNDQPPVESNAQAAEKPKKKGWFS